MAREQDMKQTRKKHGRRSRRRWRWRRSKATRLSPSWRAYTGSPEPDLRLEEAAAGRRGGRFRRRRRGIGGYRQRGAGRSSVSADWPAEGRKRFFVTKARQMSRVERRALVERAAPALPVSRQCRLLSVSRASVYRRPAEISEEDGTIMALIDRQYLARPYYGSRRMAAWLATQGHLVNRKRVRRLMRLAGLVAIYQRPNTSKPAPAHKIYPYLLGGISIERVNQVWCADVTYIPMAKGFLYLVVIMDWVSRAVLAWRLSNTLGAEFCVEALEEALARHGRPEIFNTDQGSQFTSDGFTGTLKAHDVTISMDGKGRCMDNIFVKRLWRSLKYEEVYLHAYVTVAEAKAGIGTWISFYNQERQHQSLGYRAPRQVYEEACGYVDDRLRRPAVLPPLPEPARKAGKCSPSPTYPQAPPPAGIDIDDSKSEPIAPDVALSAIGAEIEIGRATP